MRKSDKRRAVLAAAAGTGLMLMMGVAYVWGVYLPPLSETFGWSKAEASLPFSVFLVFYTLGMILGGRLQDRYGPRMVCTIGAFFFGLGYLLCGLVTSLVVFCLVYGVVSGLGTGFAYVTPVATAVKWFPKRKGLVSGIVISGFGLGAFIFSPLVRALISSIGWEKTFLALGGSFVVFGLILSQFVVAPVPVEDESSPAKPSGAAQGIPPSQMLRTGVFWRAWCAWLLALTVGLGLMGHLVAFATETGIEPMSAAVLLSIVAIFNGAGRIGTGALSDVIGRNRTLAAAGLLLALVPAGLLMAGTNFAGLSVLSALFGLCFGSLLVLYPMIASELFGNRHLGVNYGLLFSSYGIGGFIGPLLFGAVHDTAGGYRPILLASSILCLAASWLAVGVKKAPGC